jgi:hypothetical protein
MVSHNGTQSPFAHLLPNFILIARSTVTGILSRGAIEASEAIITPIRLPIAPKSGYFYQGQNAVERGKMGSCLSGSTC